MIKFILLSIAAIFIIVVFIFAYFGGFTSPKIEIKEHGGQTVIYKTHIGDYKKAGKIMDEVYYSLLNEYKINTFKGYAKYFDNPQKTETAKLRSEIGCIIEEKDLNKIQELTNAFEIKQLEKKSYFATSFPYKGKLSILLGVIKIYSALNKHAENNGYDPDGSIIEITDVPNKTTLYLKEIVKK